MLADAREEVAELTKRRDAIAGELGNLSGVIEALAVADASAGTGQQGDRSGPTPFPQPGDNDDNVGNADSQTDSESDRNDHSTNAVSRSGGGSPGGGTPWMAASPER
jgi:hypothetical protein